MAIAETFTNHYVNNNAKNIKSDYWHMRKEGFLFLEFNVSGRIIKKSWISKSLAVQILPYHIAQEAIEYVDTPRGKLWDSLKDSLIVVGYCQYDDTYSMQDYTLEVV